MARAIISSLDRVSCSSSVNVNNSLAPRMLGTCCMGAPPGSCAGPSQVFVSSEKLIPRMNDELEPLDVALEEFDVPVVPADVADMKLLEPEALPRRFPAL